MGQAARKVIPLPTDRGDKKLGTDELNICEFPLSVFGRVSGDAPKTLTFEDEIFDEGSGKLVHRRLMVSASDAFGLPRPSDTDVLLVLMHLTGERNAFTKQQVKFTRYELAKLLGWDQGGKSYKRLQESLNRWASVTLFYNHAWWDKKGRAWRSRTFHVLESVDLRGREDEGDEGLSTFTWNDVLFESFKANNMKRLDLGTYFALNSPAARQAYRFLDKRFWNKKRLQFDLRAFACEHIGLSRSYDNGQLKRKLRRPLKELEEIGFLKPTTERERFAKESRGKWNITLISNAIEEQLPDQTEPESGSIESALTERGVSESVAKSLVKTHEDQMILEKISFHDWLLAQAKDRHPKNPAGHLAASIRENWNLPKEYLDATKPKAPTKQKSTKAASQSRATDEVEERRAKEFDAFWKSLSKTKQLELEKKATQGMGKVSADSYSRLRKKGGALFEQMRRSAILSYAERNSLF